MTQPSFLDPSGPVGAQREWQSANGMQRSVLGAPSSSTLLATDTNVRYADPGGSDATGNGSRSAPFRTVAPAIAACLAAGATLANPFAVRVSPGAGYGAFTLAPNVYVIGSGTGAGSYNGAPQSGVTFLSPTAAQTLSAGWAGATVQSGGILNAVLTTAVNCDFAAIGSAAPSTLLFDDVQTDSAITCKGSANLEYATLRSVYLNGGVDLTFTDMGGSTLQGCSNDFGGFVRYNQAAAIQGFHVQVGCAFGALVTNWTSAAIANFLLVQMFTPFNGLNDGSSVIAGAGSSVIAPGSTFSATMSDAANRLSFGNVAAATIIGVSCARNIIRCTPTAARLLTIDRPSTNTGSTEIILQNLGTFPLDFALQVSPIAAGSPTYVPPQSQARILFDFAQAGGTILWSVSPIVQSGSNALTNGVSANILADITARSRITATLKTVSGAFGTPVCGGRVIGTRAGGGLFVITSTLPATGATVATDQGTYDWQVDNQGG